MIFAYEYESVLIVSFFRSHCFILDQGGGGIQGSLHDFASERFLEILIQLLVQATSKRSDVRPELLGAAIKIFLSLP